jgi:hypothetical protein
MPNVQYDLDRKVSPISELLRNARDAGLHLRYTADRVQIASEQSPGEASPDLDPEPVLGFRIRRQDHRLNDPGQKLMGALDHIRVAQRLFEVARRVRVEGREVGSRRGPSPRHGVDFGEGIQNLLTLGLALAETLPDVDRLAFTVLQFVEQMRDLGIKVHRAAPEVGVVVADADVTSPEGLGPLSANCRRTSGARSRRFSEAST